MPSRLRRYARRLLCVPFLASWVGCHGCSQEPPPSWLNRDGGGEFGRRVRAGNVEGLTHNVFRSNILEQDVGLLVATPPGYRERSDERFPVLYMFPAIGGDEWSYVSDLGTEALTLQALFADAANAPLVVFANPGSSGGYGAAGRVLGEELVAFVDSSYRTRTTAAARSLEGFSLGGATALALLLQYPDVFGRAVAASSACYLISSCGALRAQLRNAAKPSMAGRVLLSVGSLEAAANAEINEELGRLMRVPVMRIPGTDHNWGAQLSTRVDGIELGRRLAGFHLTGFAAGR